MSAVGDLADIEAVCHQHGYDSTAPGPSLPAWLDDHMTAQAAAITALRAQLRESTARLNEATARITSLIEDIASERAHHAHLREQFRAYVARNPSID